jgi:hypothetical protein
MQFMVGPDLQDGSGGVDLLARHGVARPAAAHLVPNLKSSVNISI